LQADIGKLRTIQKWKKNINILRKLRNIDNNEWDLKDFNFQKKLYPGFVKGGKNKSFFNGVDSIMQSQQTAFISSGKCKIS